jgi:predicted GIY-YIG superfamily endonuclease
MCILLETIPTQDQIDQWEEVEVYKAPPGSDEIPKVPTTKTYLLNAGWKRVGVGKHPDRKYNLGHNGLIGIREQYGLRHRIAMTVHSIMGYTVPALVTEIGLGSEKSLWGTAQVIVLLSRTELAQDIYFIGSLHNVVEALWNALQSRDQFSDYMQHLLDALCMDNTQHAFVINQSEEYPFRQKDVELPLSGEYCCYLIVSLRDHKCTYVGQTRNLRRRLNQHNSQQGGSSSTARSHLKPWGLFAYVVGFADGRSCLDFETHWQAGIENEQARTHGSLTGSGKIAIAERVIRDEEAEMILKVIICGSQGNID